MRTYLDFEKPIAELEAKIEELNSLESNGNAVSVAEEIATLQGKAKKALEETYAKLTPWQKTQVARHPERPHFMDYVTELFEEFTPLAGDRAFADDTAIIGGLGRFRGRPVMVIGHEKGDDTQSRLNHNFGMARPEGLPQGNPLDGHGRQVSDPRHHVRRHARGLSRRRCGRARPGRSDRALHRALHVLERANHRHRNRRGWIRRRRRHRDRQLDHDAGARDLYGRLARSGLLRSCGTIPTGPRTPPRA